mmetsp:Transcript_1471/g.2032  ORF Transcript_1471/g.2032 Transcript_1471/m.2032 type:complete len:190 (+) Transcript_1471:116-685(+)|eukprot:CAMPEP_0198145550 /NCGR_PEP_ID=MMETSP1443-20131203/24268_1 /TAXON_ID=186043 /ORGANISM="Entomoneis sp., Strain CCMP2396" /LENGTH=189 /DNA_ID=CAMNT_0043809237 /DNA_START=58 /DNA_END=627 /DNA_ORIENTATION=+
MEALNGNTFRRSVIILNELKRTSAYTTWSLFGRVTKQELQHQARNMATIGKPTPKTTTSARTSLSNFRASSSSGSSAAPTAELGGSLPYGIRRIDYSTPPIKVPLAPPPPPPKNIIKRNYHNIVTGMIIALFATAFIYRDDSVQDYWTAVEHGHLPDDGEDDDDDDEDAGATNLEEDEWEDNQKKSPPS